MKLIVENNSWTLLDSATEAETRWLTQFVSYQETRWGGPTPTTVRESLLDRRGHMPTGLVPVARKGAREAELQFELEDRRVRPCPPDSMADVAWLRDYQQSVVQLAHRGASRGLIKAPTGSGKSEIGIALTRVLPCEWLMLVHRIDLVDQFARRYQLRTGERPGAFLEGQWRPGTCNLTCASFQSVYSALQRGGHDVAALVAATQGLLVDESHAQAADTLFATTQAFVNAYYRFGLSGTPLSREDKDSLMTMGALGPLVHRIPTETLIAAGVLSRAVIRMAKLEQGGQHGSWREAHKELVLKSPERNRLVVDLVMHATKPTLVFVAQVKHGGLLTQMLRDAHVNAAFANGKDDLERRQRKIRELVAGGTEALVCTGIFQEGIDIPELRSVVNAVGGQSEVATLQRLGRGMRTCAADGKDSFEMWDVLDTGHKWLSRHALTRKASYESEGHTVEVIG